ncbi:MAG: EamA family transporter, partial [Prevotella sp.]
ASMLTIGCIALATCGIALLYKGDAEGALSTAGLLLVLLSALTYAIYMVAVNGRRMKEIPTLKLTLYVIFFGLFLFAFRFDTHSIDILRSDYRLWIYAFALALFPTAVSLLCTSVAIQKIGSTPVAVLGALEPVTAVFFAVTVFNEQLTIRLIIGILMIITAVTLIISGGNIDTPLLRIRKMFPRIKRHKQEQ